MVILNPFHLAIPVHDIDACRPFYLEVLECQPGRSSETWLDLNFFGHQLVLHQTDMRQMGKHNDVDGHKVPVPHFGVVMCMPEWHALVQRLEAHQVTFLLPPHIRFQGKAGEQATCFVQDPAGNALEFKAFADMDRLFATD